jgi:hypothetical protein
MGYFLDKTPGETKGLLLFISAGSDILIRLFSLPAFLQDRSYQTEEPADMRHGLLIP